MKKLIAVLPVIALLSACGGPSGFNNPDVLAADLMASYNSNPKVQAIVGQAITKVSCLNTGGQSFDCRFGGADGKAWVVSFTVSPDGSRWMGKAGQ